MRLRRCAAAWSDLIWVLTAMLPDQWVTRYKIQMKFDRFLINFPEDEHRIDSMAYSGISEVELIAISRSIEAGGIGIE